MKSTSKLLALFLLMTFVLAGGSLAFADPIVNGTFNTPSSSVVPWGTNASGPQTVDWTLGSQYAYDPTNIAGWTFTGGAGVQQNGSAWGFLNPPGGVGQSAFLQAYNGGIGVPKGAPSTISQDLTGLTAGVRYYLSFDMARRGGYGQNPVSVTIDNTHFTPTVPASNVWGLYDVSFVADGTSELLTFAANFPLSGIFDNDTGIANVDIGTTMPLGSTPIPSAPEPASLMLLGTGILGLALVVRRSSVA